MKNEKMKYVTNIKKQAKSLFLFLHGSHLNIYPPKKNSPKNPNQTFPKEVAQSCFFLWFKALV